MRDFFYTGSIIFRQFPATLVFVAESPLPDEGFFLHRIYPFQAIFQQLWFLWQKSPPPPWWGKFFYTGSNHFRQFLEIFVLLQKSPPRHQDVGNFLYRIYPFQAIPSNFGFCGRKALHLPPGWGIFFTQDLSISGNFQQLWFLWQKSPLSPQDESKFFYTGSIHFGQFSATLVFVAEKPSPPRIRENYFTQDLSIFRQFPTTLVFVSESPSPQDEGHFFTQDLSISGNFQQLWFLWQKSPLPPGWGTFFTMYLYISGNFQQHWFLWQKAPSPRMR